MLDGEFHVKSFLCMIFAPPSTRLVCLRDVIFDVKTCIAFLHFHITCTIHSSMIMNGWMMIFYCFCYACWLLWCILIIVRSTLLRSAGAISNYTNKNNILHDEVFDINLTPHRKVLTQGNLSHLLESEMWIWQTPIAGE